MPQAYDHTAMSQPASAAADSACLAEPDAGLARVVERALGTYHHAGALTADLRGPVPPAIQARQHALFDQAEALVDQVARTPAHGMAGLAAKGKLLRYLLLPWVGPADGVTGYATPEERVVFSLTADLIRLNGVR